MPAALTSLHALLIGIDFYLPNDLEGCSYPILRGSVEDVQDVRRYLEQDLGVPERQIRLLTASYVGDPLPPEPHRDWPTYDNMVAAIRGLDEEASPGDQVLIYFSGHGAQVATLLPEPERKGEHGLDECLVPLDIGSPEACYLRDIEIAELLRALADKEDGKGLFVTLVLDCCHSGGATRELRALPRRFPDGGGPVVKGARGGIDRTPRPVREIVASREKLARTWDMTISGVPRSRGWLSGPRGHVLLAACRPGEVAYETTIGGRRRGAFTHSLVKSLRHLPPDSAYKHLHDQVLASVHSRFETQVPMLEGDTWRVVLGGGHRSPHYAVNVQDVDLAGGRVMLHTGELQRVRPGMLFAIHPSGEPGRGTPDQRIAVVEVLEVGASFSWAGIVRFSRPAEELVAGSQAVLLNVGKVQFRRTVRCSPSTLPPAWLHDLERLVEGSGLLRKAENECDFLVAGTEDGSIEILDPGGEVLLRLEAEPFAKRAFDALIHLARFRNVQEIKNTDPSNPLCGRLLLELGELPEGYRPPAPLVPVKSLGNPAIVEDGRLICLTIRNESRQDLNVVVLDLEPQWSIEQVFPDGGFGQLEFLPAGEQRKIPLDLDYVPSDLKLPRDVLKVFATTETPDFRWLQLPVLGEPPPATRSLRSESLDNLFAALMEGASRSRALEPSLLASWEWTVEQVEVEITK